MPGAIGMETHLFVALVNRYRRALYRAYTNYMYSYILINRVFCCRDGIILMIFAIGYNDHGFTRAILKIKRLHTHINSGTNGRTLCRHHVGVDGI